MLFSRLIPLLLLCSSASPRYLPTSHEVEHKRSNGGLAKHHSAIVKRALDYDTALQKGKDLWEDLKTRCKADEVTDPSLAKLTGDLNNEDNPGLGWTVFSADDTEGPPDGVENKLKELGLSTGNDYYERYASSPYTRVNGDDVRTEYANTYGPKAGAIIAEDNKRAGSAIPWSVVTAFIWQDTCKTAGTDPASLKYIFRDNIINADTKALIDKVGMGKTFNPDSDSFNALLGSANGRGVAFILLQHSSFIGKKTIKSIETFQSTNNKYEIKFEFEDWTPPQQEEQPPGTGNPPGTGKLRRREYDQFGALLKRGVSGREI